MESAESMTFDNERTQNLNQGSRFSNIEELDAEDESESEIGAEGNLHSKIAKLTSSRSGGDSIRSL